jgi:uncharacterized membrane protein
MSDRQESPRHQERSDPDGRGSSRSQGRFAGRLATNPAGSDWEPEVGHTPRSHRQGHAAGHAHTHVPGNLSVSAHTRRVVLAILVPAAIATLIGLIVLWPDQVNRAAPPEGQVAYGEVLTVIETACPPGLPPGTSQTCGEADIRLTEGTGAGSVVTVELPVGPGAPSISEGDEVVLNYIPASELGPARYSVVDHQRGQEMIFLLALCAAVIVAFGRWRGLTAIVGLAVSFGVLLTFVIPGILGGSNPLLIAIVGSAAIMFAVLYLTHGVNVHTSVAILGTLMALVLTGLLGAAFTGLLHLTGFGTEETLYLSMTQSTVDMRGLLLAGIIIGALGVLDDVTVTQATTVAELARSPMSRFDLYRSAARVGRAHIASAVNTIVLAYAGASLPLLLLITVSGTSISEILSGQLLAQEIVRSAVGTIGLVAAVPITTALAALVADRDPHPTD